MVHPISMLFLVFLYPHTGITFCGARRPQCWMSSVGNIEFRASHLLGMCSTIQVTAQSTIVVFSGSGFVSYQTVLKAYSHSLFRTHSWRSFAGNHIWCPEMGMWSAAFKTSACVISPVPALLSFNGGFCLKLLEYYLVRMID